MSHTPADLERLVVDTVAGQPVYLRDLAEVADGPEEPQQFVFLGPGIAAAHKGQTVSPARTPAVTLTIAKRAGTNAVDVAEEVLAKLDTLKGHLLPAEVRMTITRNSGDTAQEKADELLKHLLIAIVSVMLIVALFLGMATLTGRFCGDSRDLSPDAVPVLLRGLHAQSHHLLWFDPVHWDSGG